jgi:pilus assembly protein CpaE
MRITSLGGHDAAAKEADEVAHLSSSADRPSRSLKENDSLGPDLLSVVVIGPDERRREALARGFEATPCQISLQLSGYPEMDQFMRVVKLNCDVVVFDLDPNPEYSLECVENLCAASQSTVMVYSSSTEPEMMLRSMRAGAREFLPFPIVQSTISAAVVRAAARRAVARNAAKIEGRLCVFCGAKGGAGATTLAVNFAVSAARLSPQSVCLIDLDLPLGDTALQLGLVPQYSTVDALKNSARLDVNFLSKLVTKHDSGLCVLSAPGSFVPFDLSTEAVNRLIAVARQEFECVVVDAGSRFELMSTSLFDSQAKVYLVSQVGISELRNSNRIVSELFPAALPHLEIVLNRFAPTSLGVDEEHITRALTRHAKWRIPEERDTAREMQNTATPLALGDTQASRVIRQMARDACGLPAETEKRKRLLGLF